MGKEHLRKVKKIFRWFYFWEITLTGHVKWFIGEEVSLQRVVMLAMVTQI